MSSLASKMFFCLAGCFSVLIDSPTHFCWNTQCCIHLLLDAIFAIRNGRAVVFGLEDQVETWIHQKESTEPFQIMQRFFQESSQCASEFFKEFLIKSSKRLSCNCEVILESAPYTMLGISLIRSGPSFQGDINKYFMDRQRCNECLNENAIRNRELSSHPEYFLVRNLRMGGEDHPSLLMVEGKNYRFHCGLASNDGREYIVYFEEGLGRLVTYGQYGKRGIYFSKYGLKWHIIFFKKCPEDLAAPVLDGSGPSLQNPVPSLQVVQRAPGLGSEENIFGDLEIQAHQRNWPTHN